MARKPRIHIPGGFYHVMLRGNGGQDIYFNHEDRNHFYLLLQQGTANYGHRIHGFCCMTNHVHFLIQVADIPLSKIMQNISFRYTRWVNKHQNRNGHLFQGRYKTILVDGDQYLLELIRYIHLNPVRAGLVNRVEDYPWSSHHAYIGEDTLPWLTTDWVYGQFGRQKAACIRKYKAYLAEGVGEQYRSEFHCGVGDSRILGEDSFTEKVLEKVDAKPMRTYSLKKIIAAVCVSHGVKENVLKLPGRQREYAEVRAIIAWLAKDLTYPPLKEVADYFGRDLSTISAAATRVGRKMQDDNVYAREIRLLISAITQA